ncbi:hypothetical protein PR048_032751 [Dryococelus australis]|uniref:Uncharacterized protein n=1 Tax=Dryococelus australis TaxID=614101 RepID=A0ABQ9G339_9NEOP|nr:hypothetical protein PR048_032751 [Dryococelus australis]
MNGVHTSLKDIQSGKTGLALTGYSIQGLVVAAKWRIIQFIGNMLADECLSSAFFNISATNCSTSMLDVTSFLRLPADSFLHVLTDDGVGDGLMVVPKLSGSCRWQGCTHNTAKRKWINTLELKEVP